MSARPEVEAALKSGDPLNQANAACELFAEIGVPPSKDEAQRIIAMRLASPKRADAGAVIVPQQDAGHLPLFVAANEPRLI